MISNQINGGVTAAGMAVLVDISGIARVPAPSAHAAHPIAAAHAAETPRKRRAAAAVAASVRGAP